MSNQNSRVLGRMGARYLTPAEEAIVTGGGSPPGGRQTTTICSIACPPLPADGDPGEC